MTVAGIYQNGIGLSDRDYFLEDDTNKIQEAYKIYLQKILSFSGDDEVFKKICNFEYQLAQSFYT